MKKIAIIFASLISAACINTAIARDELDRIVAVVNDDVVTRTEVADATRIVKAQLEQQHGTLPSAATLHKQVLDQVINKKLQLQIAKTVGINISDKEIDKTIDRIAKQNNISSEELYERINQEGYSPRQYRNELREQLTVQRLQQQEVVNHIVVSPEEVNNFINSKSWVDNSSNEYRLEDILVPVSDTPSTAELTKAKQHAQALLDKIRKGADFNKIAQSESASNALSGGDLGWRSLAEIPSAFGEVVVHMQKNAVNGPIQTANGYHIIRLVDVRSSGGKQQAPDKKQIENLLMQRKFEEAVMSWVSRLRAQAYIVMTEKA